MQALLIYKLCNKNHLKNINDQNYAHFMRGYDKGFYSKSYEYYYTKISNQPSHRYLYYLINKENIHRLF